jgi:gliding motility associated protien GldN
MNILNKYRIAAIAASLFVSSASFAQNITDQGQTQTAGNDEAVNTAWKPSLVKDGVYDRTPHTMKALDWQPVREADILWKKRVWREIDVREKQNVAFRYPGDENTGGGYFIEILMDAIKKGKIKAYSNFDDRFTQAFTKEQILEQMTGKDDSTEVPDPVTGQVKIVVTHKEFDVERVTKYRLKEDWIFDRNLGRMVVRIIGIAPIVDNIDPNTLLSRGQSSLFWIYYPEARGILAQYEVYNPDNDVQRLTWDDFFEGRFFSSRIIKISNPFDEVISAQHPGMEGLYEAQRTTEMIFNKEHDMWVY